MESDSLDEELEALVECVSDRSGGVGEFGSVASSAECSGEVTVCSCVSE